MRDNKRLNEQAAKDFEEPVCIDSKDPASISVLILAYSEFDRDLAEKYGASLTVIVALNKMVP